MNEEQRRHGGELHRSDDGPFITVKRDVPIWALIVGLVTVVGSGVNLQIGQNRQAEKTQELASKVDQLNVNYTAEIAGKLEMKYSVESLKQQLATQQQAIGTLQQAIAARR